MIPGKDRNEMFFDFGGYNHYLLRKSDVDVVILSTKISTWIDQLTRFSYLFCFYGLLLLPLMFQSNQNNSTRRTLTLAMKIQLMLFTLVFLSLLTFGWGSGVFVRNQYNEFTSDVIREKLKSVETEVKAKLGNFETLSIDKNGDYMQYILQKFARVFFTDINLYDADGYLLATSRPKVFNVGLLSEQMNPTALSNLKYGKRSGFVQQERIGELAYTSAYQPFYNSADKHLAYINLQHFGQQSEFESQIQKFLVAIINVFILLLAISLILAVFISNWLTAPLRILQESFAQVKFAKRNERISYAKDDEIGALVQEYNMKLDELEFTAEQLAKSERESAWREMAKQVAHEIKNPLTPMRLSVQQLLRTYDPSDPNSKSKLDKVANSIIEQIDSLTKIANEFSNFAKMPSPTEERVDFVSLVNNVAEVFNETGNSTVTFESNVPEVYIRADKDQMMRVFNNLIKNAIQAIPADREGEVSVRLNVKGDKVEALIKDNGIGIEPEKQSKIFVPYFTTKSTGTGLGLAMVKQIIENHRGSIDFDSVVNEGTTFIIVLPIDEQ
jgi:signal transduction histidine kinase